jgi:integrase/recombinase XerD
MRKPPRALNPRRRKRRKAAPYDPVPLNPLRHYQREFKEWSLASGWSEHTARTQEMALLRFIVWCDERGITRVQDITRPILERYQRHLYHYRKSNGAPLSVVAQLGLLTPILAWFRWLVRNHHILYNPAADLELPKKPKALPKTILTTAQVESIINQADVTTLLGLRNRAIMETFYSSGMRRLELMNLKLYDLDIERGMVMIRQGKGRKDRFIPIGERACKWIDKYLIDVRPELVTGHDDHTVFLDDFGRPLSARFVGDLMRRHVEAAGITTPGACHVFRHAMATHMLENGADIRYIQVMLGHANLETTQVYTQVSIGKLKEVHDSTHPATLTRTKTSDATDAQTCAQRDALLTALAAETKEESDDSDEHA